MRALSLPQLVDVVTRCRPGQITGIEAASKLALKSLATRYQQLTAEITTLDAEIEQLAHQAAPQLMAIKGVGADTAGALLAAAGDNPNGCAPSPRSRTCAESRRSRLRPARPTGTGSTTAATKTPTAPSTSWRWASSATTNAPAPTRPGALPRARANARSSAASSVTSPARSSQPY
jgi:hypothetical protein